MSAGGQATGDLLTIVDVSEAAAADKNKKITMENLFKGIPGNVGIGASSPGTDLDVNNGSANCTIRARTATGFSSFLSLLPNGSGTGIALAANSDSSAQLFNQLNSHLAFGTNNTERARIDSSGRLLVGTSTARAVGGESNPRLHIEGVGASSNSWVNISRYVNSNGGPAIQLAKSRGTSGGSYTVVADGDTLGTLGFLGSDGTDLATYGAKITGEVDGTPGSNSMPGRLTFYTTAASSSSPTERLRINNAGRFFFNETSSDLGHKYILSGNESADVAAFQYNSNTGTYLAISTGAPNGVVEIKADARSGSFPPLTFKTGSNETMRLDSSGRLLVGTTTEGAANADNLTIADSGHAGMTIRSGTTSKGAVFFSDATSGTGEFEGVIEYNHSDNSMLFFTSGSEAARIDSSGNVGINTSSPGAQLDVSGQIVCQDIVGRQTDDTFPVFRAVNAAGTSTTFRVDSDGDATFAGAVSKGSGSFRIDHPLKAETHQLVHSFVESPQADNIYRGKVDLVAGTAAVNIDTVAGMTEGTFVALNREIQCFTTNETGWTAIKGSVTGNVLTITAQEDTCTDTISWLVIGERQDQHMYDTSWTDENGKVIVEPEKPVAASEAE